MVFNLNNPGSSLYVSFALPGYLGWNIASRLFSTLINLEIIRISFAAVKRKKRGAWIMVGVLFVI
jgi:hypothetical protein